MIFGFLNSQKRKEKDLERAVNNAMHNLTESYIGTERITAEDTVLALVELNKRVYQNLKDQKLNLEEKTSKIQEAINYLEIKSK